MNSTMKSKLLSLLKKVLLPLAFWLIVWQILATFIDDNFLFPDISATFHALLDLLGESSFYYAILLSAARVILGLISGVAAGFVLALLCSRFDILKCIILPVIRIIKSTPVASFIVVLWVLMSGDALSIFIGFLMVMPIIFQNVSDGILAVDNQLIELSEVFEFSGLKKFRLITVPSIERFLIPAVITASGFAWKAEIAAEIIAYTKNSIGQGINDAKYYMDTPTIFAWTVVIIALSISLEAITAYVMRRVKNES